MIKEKSHFLWLMVTHDEYEFPIYIADTADQLAAMAGVKGATAIVSAIKKARDRGYWCRYRKVLIDPDD